MMVDPRRALEEYCSCLSLSYAARMLGVSVKVLKKTVEEHYGWPPDCITHEEVDEEVSV